MLFKGIILTGTYYAGAHTIAQVLCKPDEDGMPSKFEIVFSVTTRTKCHDDFNYEYVDDTQFSSLVENDKLMVEGEYRGGKYGVKIEKYEEVLANSRIPILIIPPSLLETCKDNFMSFFIDVADEELLTRFQIKEKRTPERDEERDIKTQREQDRKVEFEANYVLKNNEVDNSVALIKLLWEYRGKGGGMPDKIIKSMISCDMLLEKADAFGVKGASYDLLLGDEYYYGGKIKKLSDSSPFLTIEPYDYAIVSSKERACMPRDVIAKFGLTVGLFCQGIVLSNGPQIDPGFRGTLFCLLFNTSNRAVHLKRGTHYATIEFNKLIEAAKPYAGQYQDSEKIIEYIPANALQGAINELKKEVEKLQRESRMMQNIYLGVVGLMFAMISILLILR